MKLKDWMKKENIGPVDLAFCMGLSFFQINGILNGRMLKIRHGYLIEKLTNGEVSMLSFLSDTEKDECEKRANKAHEMMGMLNRSETTYDDYLAYPRKKMPPPKTNRGRPKKKVLLKDQFKF